MAYNERTETGNSQSSGIFSEKIGENYASHTGLAGAALAHKKHLLFLGLLDSVPAEIHGCRAGIHGGDGI